MIKKPWNTEGKLSLVESFKWLLIIATIVATFSIWFNQSYALSTLPPFVSTIVMILLTVHFCLIQYALLKDILSVLSIRLITFIKKRYTLKTLSMIQNDTIRKKYSNYLSRLFLKLRVIRI
jgi:hypothetical protein